jgi:glycosyltransferase involved in cell wall biosynthesis
MERKIKVLVISTQFSKKSCGGAGVYIFEMVKALANNDVEMHIMAPNNTSYKEVINDNFIIHWQRNIPKRGLFVPSFYYSVKKNYINIIVKEKIDIIHGNNVAGFVTIGSLPLVTTIHHPASLEVKYYGLFMNLLNTFDVYLEPKIMKSSKKIIAVSHLTSKLLIKKYPAIKNKIKIIGEGVDLNKYHLINGRKLREKLKIPDKTIVIFFPGGARGRRKGAEIVIESLKKLGNEYNFKCIMTGKSREFGWEKRFNKLLIQSGLSEKFIITGDLEYTELPKYYGAADIVVYPSFFEGFGIPIMEAMACNKPVIATKTGEAKYIITNMKNGILINPGDSDALYKKIKLLIDNTDIRVRIGKKARTIIEQSYNWNNFASKIKQLYKEVLDGNNKK